MSVRRWMMIGLIAALSAMAAMKFIRQDISSEINDFVYVYVAGNAWLNGMQPYTYESLNAEADKLYGPQEASSYKDLDIYYPPTTFFAMIPILLLPHQWVIPTVLLASLAGYLWIVWLLTKDLTGLSRYLFFAFALNYAPLHSGLRPRNVTVLMAAVILIPLLLAARNRMSSSWWFVLLGLGVAIKPQLGLPFLAILFVMREWKRFYVALSTTAASVLFSVGWLALHGIHWIAPLLANLRSGPSGGNDESMLSFVYNGAANFRLLNLSPVVFLFSGNYRLSGLLPVVLAAGLFLWLAFLVWRRQDFWLGSEAEWISVFAATGSIALLPAYSRYYGAIFILPLFAWMWIRARRPLRKAVLVAGSVLFSLPVPQFPVIWAAVVQYVQNPGVRLSQVLAGITQERFEAIRPAFWQELICTLPNLFLLASAVLLLAILAESGVQQETVDPLQEVNRTEVLI